MPALWLRGGERAARREGVQGQSRPRLCPLERGGRRRLHPRRAQARGASLPRQGRAGAARVRAGRPPRRHLRRGDRRGARVVRDRRQPHPRRDRPRGRLHDDQRARRHHRPHHRAGVRQARRERRATRVRGRRRPHAREPRPDLAGRAALSPARRGRREAEACRGRADRGQRLSGRVSWEGLSLSVLCGGIGESARVSRRVSGHWGWRCQSTTARVTHPPGDA
mmetsp:Transcript_46041/g.144828  ORF Transcript_46041/g.144828 Transcript_46041/m.144828 type:complete len:223 (+) Transcript_46041:1373-2041(+)